MERVVSVLLREWTDSQRTELHLVLYGRHREIFFPVPDRVRLHVPDFEFDRWPRVVATLMTAQFLRATVGAIAPDRIISFGELWNNFVLLALAGHRKRILVADRSSPRKRFSQLQEVLRSHLYSRSRGIIVQTRVAHDIYARRWPNHAVHVIGNPVPIPSIDGSPSRHQRILSVGRLIDTKHHDRLIRVFARVARGSDWELILVGDDAQRQSHSARLIAVADALGVSSQVRFEGAVRDVGPYYRSCSIFAFTSSSEGFPNALAEAMAHGLAVASYDCVAGPSELIDDGKTGYLVPVFDDAALESRLRELMHSERLRQSLGEEARAATSRFASTAIANRFMEALQLDRAQPPTR